MDLPEPSLASQKAELIRALEDCRQSMVSSADEMASALDLPSQFRASFASGSWRWLAASLAAGVLTGIALSFRNKSRSPGSVPPPKAPLTIRVAQTLLRGTFESLAIPILHSLLQGKGEKWLGKILDKSQS